MTALCLLVAHVAGAQAAAMPVMARGAVHMALRWWRPTAVLAGATLAGAPVLALLDRWSPPGSIVVVLATLVAVAAGAWLLTSDAPRRPPRP